MVLWCYIPKIRLAFAVVAAATSPGGSPFSSATFSHTNRTWDDMCRIIGEEATAAAEAGRRLRGVFHAFSEDAVTYRKLKACGDFAFGIGGVVTFRKSKLADTVREMELDDIVLETDCPYLTPAPHRGERNESAYVRFVCEKVAELKGLPPGEVAAATTANAKRIFGI